MTKILEKIPGVFLAVLIAIIATFIESLLPIHVIGASVIALFIGMLLNKLFGNDGRYKSGIKFTSKKLLKVAIILLGLSLNIKTILHVGKLSLVVMIFTLATCFGGGYFIGKALGLNWKLSNLISSSILFAPFLLSSLSHLLCLCFTVSKRFLRLFIFLFIPSFCSSNSKILIDLSATH